LRKLGKFYARAGWRPAIVGGVFLTLFEEFVPIVAPFHVLEKTVNEYDLRYYELASQCKKWKIRRTGK
jgi:hypothetical protein